MLQALYMDFPYFTYTVFYQDWLCQFALGVMKSVNVSVHGALKWTCIPFRMPPATRPVLCG